MHNIGLRFLSTSSVEGYPFEERFIEDSFGVKEITDRAQFFWRILNQTLSFLYVSEGQLHYLLSATSCFLLVTTLSIDSAKIFGTIGTDNFDHRCVFEKHYTTLYTECSYSRNLRTKRNSVQSLLEKSRVSIPLIGEPQLPSSIPCMPR